MRVGLTGATGFIGSQLAELLVEKGHQVACLVRGTSSLRWIEGLPVELHYGEILDPPSLEDFVRGRDVIFHLAGTAKGRTDADIIEANRTGTKNLCAVIGRHNPNIERFVFVSSSEAMGLIQGNGPSTEDIPPAPITVYGKSKAAAEEVVASCPDLPYTVVRPSPVFGPRDRDVFIMFKLIEGNFLPMPKLNGTLSMIYSRNLVRGLLQCALCEAARRETYFLADDGYYTWQDITGFMARALDKNPLRVGVPIPVIRLLGNISSLYSRVTNRATILSKEKFLLMTHSNLTVSNAKAKRDFGYTTEVPLPEAIRETAVWYRESGWL